MTIQILDSNAWREYRGQPGGIGKNKTTHLARIEDAFGGMHDCVVKLLPLKEPSLLCEAIGWLLAKTSGVTSPAFGCIVVVPLDRLRRSHQLPTEFDGVKECPAWCCELVRGKSVLQVHRWIFWLAKKMCLQSKDARIIASFDAWMDLRDRNFGNVVRSLNGGYVSIDHETLLHDLLWPRAGKIFHERSLWKEAQNHLSAKDYAKFEIDMALAAKEHNPAFELVWDEVESIVKRIYPAQAPILVPEILQFIDQRAQEGWLSTELGVIV